MLKKITVLSLLNLLVMYVSHAQVCNISVTSKFDGQCSNSNDGAVTVLATGGSSTPFSYLWSNGGTTANITGLSGGIYSVTAVDLPSTCNVTTSVNISPPDVISSTEIVMDAQCNGGSAGVITANVTGGVSPYQFIWDNGATTESVSGLAKGVYWYTVQDVNNCKHVDLSGVNFVTELFPDINISSSSPCIGESFTFDANGSSVSSGTTSGYTYTWDLADGSALKTGDIVTYIYSSLVDNKAIGLTMTSANGVCVAEQTQAGFSVTSAQLDVFHTPVTCNGGSDGKTNNAVSYPITSIDYLWNTGSTSVQLTGVPAGVYSVTTTDFNGCMAVTFNTITEPLPISMISTTTDVTCNGDSDGTAIINVTGGTSPYNNALGSAFTSFTLTNLAPGPHVVTVTDQEGCFGSGMVSITEPLPMNITTTILDISCHGANDGEIEHEVEGGTSPYQYIWSFMGSGTTSSESGLGPGIYGVDILDNSGCSVSVTDTVFEPPAITVSVATSASCGTGTLSVNALGGATPYNYFWNTGLTGSTVSVSSSGSYNVTVADFDFCEQTANVNIIIPPVIDSITFSITPDTCGKKVATATANAYGGTSPYHYLWSNNETTQNITGLGLGTYVVTVSSTSAVGGVSPCLKVDSVVISEVPGIEIDITKTGPFCYDPIPLGAAQVNVLSGTPPYFYSWSNGAGTQGTSGLAVGVYQVTVVGSNGCFTTQTTAITPPVPIDSITTTFGTATCGASDGVVTAEVAIGGTSPYQYTWTNFATTQIATGPSASGLAAGAYLVFVVDANQCQASEAALVFNPFDSTEIRPYATLGIKPPRCFNSSDGMLYVDTPLPNNNYIYEWQKVGESNVTLTDTLKDLSGGAYAVKITDTNSGCVSIGGTELFGPPPLLILADSIKDETCFGASDGYAELSVVGGISPYTYIWSTGNTTLIGTGLAAGEYSITVIDANQCFRADTGDIFQTYSIPFNTALTPTTCAESSDGSIHTAITNDGSISFVDYVWSTGDTEDSLVQIPIGTYAVTATATLTDFNTCVITESITVTTDSSSTLSFTVDALGDTCAQQTGKVTILNVSGGFPEYTFSIDGINYQADPVFDSLATGEVKVFVKDSINCVMSRKIIIDTLRMDRPFDVSVDEVPPSCIGDSISLYAHGGTKYEWFNLSTDSSITVVFEEMDYFVDIYVGSCMYENLISIEIGECLVDTLEPPNAFSPDGDGINEGWEIPGVSTFQVDEIVVFNRWGDVVHQQSEVTSDKIWDGTNKNGSLVPPGTYFYKIFKENKQYSNGWIQVVR